MTVAELIEELKNYPQDYDIELCFSKDGNMICAVGTLDCVYGDKDTVSLYTECDLVD